MLRSIYWNSQETDPRLTPDEVEMLFKFAFDVAQLGQLNNGKYVGATEALYWQRLSGGN